MCYIWRCASKRHGRQMKKPSMELTTDSVSIIEELNCEPLPNCDRSHVEIARIPNRILRFNFTLTNGRTVPLSELYAGIFACTEQHARDSALSLIQFRSSIVKEWIKKGMETQSVRIQWDRCKGVPIIRRMVLTTKIQCLHNVLSRAGSFMLRWTWAPEK